MRMHRHSANSDYITEILVGSGIFIATLAAIGVEVVLVWFAILRENQAFWTNAGGYPIWLRDLVRLSFMPLGVLTLLALVALTMACFSRVCRSLRFFAIEGVLLVMCWGLFSTTAYIALNNNIRNLIEGRDFHSHGK